MLNPKLLSNRIKNAKHVASIKRNAVDHPIITSGVVTAAALLVASSATYLPSSIDESKFTEQAFADENNSYEIKLKDNTRTTEQIFPDYSEFGCDSVIAYNELLEQSKEEAQGVADNLIEELGDFLDDEQKEVALNSQTRMTTAPSMSTYNQAKSEFEAIAEQAEAAYEEYIKSIAKHYSSTSSYGYVENGGGLTRSGGVNWFNGHRETWYSSNASYHYRTGEWTLGSDGIYRDSDGYIVVASPKGANGDIIDTSLGAGKAYDHCPGGSVDIYTAW